MAVAFSSSSCLKLTSFDMDRDHVEGASILASLGGSTESQAPPMMPMMREVSTSSVGRVEEYMAAKPFMLTNLNAVRGSEMCGSAEALLCIAGGGSQDALSAPRAGSLGFSMQRDTSGLSVLREEASFEDSDRATELPFFPSKGAFRPMARSSSLCLTTISDLLGHASASRAASCSGSFDGARLPLLHLGSQSTAGEAVFLQALANASAQTAPAAESSSSTAALSTVKAEYRVDDGAAPGGTAEADGAATGAGAGAREEEEEAPAQRPVRAAAARAASRVHEGGVDGEEDEDESEEEAPQRKGPAPKRKGGAAAGGRSRKRARADEDAGRSGLHVRERPDMQKKARDGQEHWLQQVREIRRKWQDRREWEREEMYQKQVENCAAMQIKSQHECLLRTLQMSASDGLIEPLPFAECGPASFLGWTGFRVVMHKAQEFRSRIDALFPAPLKENTLHTSFRRAGLVPDKWSSGWLGLTAFKYSNDKRVAYAPTPAAAAAARGGA